MKKLLILMIATLLIGGCSTKPIKFEDATPATKVYAFQNEELPAQILVTRDSGLSGSACSVKLYIDGTLAGELGASKSGKFYVSEGEHIVGAEHNCLGTLDEIAITVKKENSIRLRISLGADGAKISRTAY